MCRAPRTLPDAPQAALPAPRVATAANVSEVGGALAY